MKYFVMSLSKLVNQAYNSIRSQLSAHKSGDDTATLKDALTYDKDKGFKPLDDNQLRYNFNQQGKQDTGFVPRTIRTEVSTFRLVTKLNCCAAVGTN